MKSVWMSDRLFHEVTDTPNMKSYEGSSLHSYWYDKHGRLHATSDLKYAWNTAEIWKIFLAVTLSYKLSQCLVFKPSSFQGEAVNKSSAASCLPAKKICLFNILKWKCVCRWPINNACGSIVRWQKERASISCAASLMKPVDSGCN